MELDAIDVAILTALQADATQTVQQMAEQVGLSTNACWRRMKLFEQNGLITARVALLDPVRAGLGTTVFVSVRTAEHSAEWLADFAAAVHEIPEVVEFYRMAGDVDYLLKLRVTDIAHYDQVYKQLIRRARLGDVSAAFAMEEIKHTTAIPLSAKP